LSANRTTHVRWADLCQIWHETTPSILVRRGCVRYRSSLSNARTLLDSCTTTSKNASNRARACSCCWQASLSEPVRSQGSTGLLEEVAERKFAWSGDTGRHSACFARRHNWNSTPQQRSSPRARFRAIELARRASAAANIRDIFFAVAIFTPRCCCKTARKLIHSHAQLQPTQSRCGGAH